MPTPISQLKREAIAAEGHSVMAENKPPRLRNKPRAKPTRLERLQVRMTMAERAAVFELAQQHGLTVSEMLRRGVGLEPSISKPRVRNHHEN